jgi:hypothetical protein
MSVSCKTGVPLEQYEPKLNSLRLPPPPPRITEICQEVSVVKRGRTEDILFVTNSMEKNIPWGANSSSASQEIPPPPQHGTLRFITVFIRSHSLRVSFTAMQAEDVT